MQGMVLSSKLLTALLAALMVWPSWATRDCCCTRRAVQTEASSCCKRSVAEPIKKLSSCCAARAKATAKQQSHCQLTSSCRCRVVLASATLPKTVQAPRTFDVRGPAWTESHHRTADLWTLSAVSLRPVLDVRPGLDGPGELCMRLCRWLT